MANTKKKKTTAKKKATGTGKKRGRPKGSKNTTKKGTSTHIIVLVDKSGSMRVVKEAAIEGFNNFLLQQKKGKGKATMTLVLFDGEYKILYDTVPIKEIPLLTPDTYVPGGTTALYYSMGRAIVTYRAKLEKMTPKEKPDKVLMVTVTDGRDECLRDYTAENVATFIAEQKKKFWQFMYIGSTEETITTSQDLGISLGNTFQFSNTNEGNRKMYAKMSKATASYRGLDVNDTVAYAASADTLLSDVKEED